MNVGHPMALAFLFSCNDMLLQFLCQILTIAEIIFLNQVTIKTIKIKV